MRIRRGRRAGTPAPSQNGPEAAEAPPAPERELASVASLSSALARARDVDTVGRTLIEECLSHLGVDFAALAVVSEDGMSATGLLALARDGDEEWWPEVSIDFETEPSGIASAVFEGGPVVVYDVAGSPMVNQRLAERVGAKSAVFVPLVTDERVLAVLVLATTKEPRMFTGDELALLQALASEAALALDRARAAGALAEAVQREPLVASRGRKVRPGLGPERV